MYKKHKIIGIVLQVILLAAVYFSLRAWKSKDFIEGVAPVINATTLQGESFDLRTHRSKPVLVHFWATWCHICQFENSNIVNIAKDYDVITLASWSESAAQVKAYLQKEKLDFPVIVDEDGEWAKVYGVRGVPASFVIDKAGVIQFIETGYTSEIGLRLRLWWLE